MSRVKLITIILVIIILIGAGYFVSQFKEREVKVNSFEECIKHYPVMETYPPKCKTPDGKTFTEGSCQSSEGDILTISNAEEIARNSECGEKLTDSHQCNENTGTWWIDLNIQKEGCNPACVVDVVSREASINWRCTGFKPGDEEDQLVKSARSWIGENSLTYTFDGEDLTFVEKRGLDLVGCENCYEVEFSFESRHAGYGDRTGKMVAQVITPHSIVVLIEDGEVTRVTTDGKFNEMTGEFLE